MANQDNSKILTTNCCIAGGGPAGMMLGLLLARAGVDVTVLEKHEDFFRDFRGDTVHPSTMEAIYELGLLDEFLKQPHQKISRLFGRIGDSKIIVADFSHLKVHAPYIAMMPQWDFLNFLAQEAKKYSNFKLIMQAEVIDIMEEKGRVSGLTAKTPEGMLKIKNKLLVGADGRHSKVRELSGLQVMDFGAPIDVLWFRLSRPESDPEESTGNFLPGKIMVMIYRGDYWQCGYVIPKGVGEKVKQEGLEKFRKNISDAIPFLRDRVDELKDWNQVKLLTVKVDRLKNWSRTGLLCIGDAAHAMSPVGGVGINFAVQDAIAAANILAEPLLTGNVTDKDLQSVQKRREWPAAITQKLQVTIQDKIIFRVLKDNKKFDPPLAFRMINKFPLLRRMTGYLIGIGFRPEHVKKSSS